MACEGITKDGAYLIGTINGGHLNRSNSNGILNQTRINKSNVSILKRCDRRRALHRDHRNKRMLNIYRCWRRKRAAEERRGGGGWSIAV